MLKKEIGFPPIIQTNLMVKQNNNDYFNKISTTINEETYDLLLTNVNSILFDYSDHHSSNKKTLIKKLAEKKTNILFFLAYIKNIFWLSKRHQKAIISNAYVPINLNDTITLLPPWSYSLRRSTYFSLEMASIIKKINKEYNKRSIKVLLSVSFKQLVADFEVELSRMFVAKKIEALIVANDLSFFENLSIKIAKRNKIPTFVYLHGLPARYNNLDDNRADYLVVWGNGIKKMYVENGVSEKKILTLKHPVYSDFEVLDLESDLKNVLVLTKAISGTPCISTELILPNRSVLLYYLELAKENLKKLGVHKASLRLHPSEENDFYFNNLPDDFYSIDTSAKEDSLSKATLVLGPTSTMVLDAIKAGKNYILFDPVFDGLTLEGAPLVAPFTGESFIKLSNTFEAIKENVENPSHNIDFNKLNAFFDVNELDYKKINDIITSNN